LWMQRLFLKRRLPGLQAAREIEMGNSGGSSQCFARELTVRKTAWFLWYVPILLVIVGASWSPAAF
jgi:hypothetical protein